MEIKKLIKIDELAQILGVSKAMLYLWTESGKIPSVRVGRLVRFDPDEVIKHFQQNTSKKHE